MPRVQIWQLALLVVWLAAANAQTAADLPPNHPGHTDDATSRDQDAADKTQDAKEARHAQVTALHKLKNAQSLHDLRAFEERFPELFKQVFELARSHLAEQDDVNNVKAMDQLKMDIETPIPYHESHRPVPLLEEVRAAIGEAEPLCGAPAGFEELDDEI